MGERAVTGVNNMVRPAERPGDKLLLARIQRGDERAFEELYHSYHARLARFLFNLLRRPQLVEEVLDDTMIAIWQKPDSFRGASKLSTWIFAIAYRKAMKALRKLDEPIEPKMPDLQECNEEAADDRIWHQQRDRLLLEALGHLSADHRAVVDLTYFHGMGYREIAEIAGCPVDTVKTRMFHARRNLRRFTTGESTDWY